MTFICFVEKEGAKLKNHFEIYYSFSKVNGKANFIKATSKCFVLFCRARTGKFKSDFKQNSMICFVGQRGEIKLKY